MEKENNAKKGCLQKIKSKEGKMSIKICTMIDSCKCENIKCCDSKKREDN
jgi:hypothetical protein